MQGSIETIEAKERFPEIFNGPFRLKDVFLKTQNGNLKILYQGYSGDNVGFEIPFIKQVSPKVVISTRYNETTIYAELKLLENPVEDFYIFEPVKIQIITISRQEDRTTVNSVQSQKSLLYVSSVITDFLIEKSLALQMRKVEVLKEKILHTVRDIFPYYKIFFSNEGKTDSRMKHFYVSPEAFLITDFSGEEIYNNDDYAFYMENIYKRDYALKNRKNLVSEISVPLLYNNLIPFGYIQVNGATKLREEAFNLVKKIAVNSQLLVKKMHILDIVEEKLVVSDLSQRGIGIVFKERKFLRYFSENSYVSFVVNLPDGIRLTMLTIVRNITIMDNKVIKIGFEIYKMSEESEKLYNIYLEKSQNKS